MNGQHLTRRIVLSAAVVGLAVLMALGGGDQVNAEIKNDNGHGSKAAFKSACEANVIDDVSGTFVDSPKDGLTVCVYGDGSKNTCDQQGNNCTYTPPPKTPSPTDSVLDSHPIVDFADVPLLTQDTQAVAPVYAPLEVIAEAPLVAIAETPVEAPVASQGASAVESGTLAAPTEVLDVPAEEPMVAEEPVAAEEPMAIEASAEQP
jgi:hypothetical protein